MIGMRATQSQMANGTIIMYHSKLPGIGIITIHKNILGKCQNNFIGVLAAVQPPFTREEYRH